MEKKTKVETLTKIYNEMLENHCRCLIDEQFYIAKATNFKQKSPDYKANMEKSKEQSTYLYWNKLLLKTIEIIIDEELQKLKSTKK